MDFLLLVSVLFRRPLTFFIGVGGNSGQGIKWRQLTHNQLMSPQGPHFSAHSPAKTNDKTQISGRMACIGISDVVTASIYSVKTRLKKLMMIMIMNI